MTTTTNHHDEFEDNDEDLCICEIPFTGGCEACHDTLI